MPDDDGRRREVERRVGELSKELQEKEEFWMAMAGFACLGGGGYAAFQWLTGGSWGAGLAVGLAGAGLAHYAETWSDARALSRFNAAFPRGKRRTIAVTFLQGLDNPDKYQTSLLKNLPDIAALGEAGKPVAADRQVAEGLAPLGTREGLPPLPPPGGPPPLPQRRDEGPRIIPLEPDRPEEGDR